MIQIIEKKCNECGKAYWKRDGIPDCTCAISAEDRPGFWHNGGAPLKTESTNLPHAVFEYPKLYTKQMFLSIWSEAYEKSNHPIDIRNYLIDALFPDHGGMRILTRSDEGDADGRRSYQQVQPSVPEGETTSGV